MAKRGFLAEVQRAAAASAKEAERRQREAQRQYAAQVRAAEKAAAAEKRAAAAVSKAQETERKQLEKDRQAAHVAACQAEAESRNAQIEAVYDDIDSLLEATLEVDDHVDLEKLRQQVSRPPFPRPDLENELHKHFADRAVNQANQRKEFFFATPAEVRQVLADKVGTALLEFSETAEATEYLQSVSYWPENVRPN